MSRLTSGYPVVAGKTADGSDAVFTVDPTTFALYIGLGTMSLQNYDTVNIVGGNINNADVGMVVPKDGQFSGIRIVKASSAPELLLAREVDADTQWKVDISSAGMLGISHRSPITGGSYVESMYINPTTGDVHAVEGNVIGHNDFELYGSMTLGGDIIATSGNVDIPNGRVTLLGSLSAGGSSLSDPAGEAAVGIRHGVADNWAYLSADPTAGTTLAYKGGTVFSLIYETGVGTGRTTAFHIDVSGKIISDANLEVGAEFEHTGTAIGFFGITPVTQEVVSYPPAVTTTETAGGSYTTNEQSMLDNLKDDVTNLRASLNEAITALKNYGIFN